MATTIPHVLLAGQTPDEFVRALSDEQKDAVLGSLLREVVRVNGQKSVLAVEYPRGEALGYFVPPAAAAAHFKAVPPPLTPEHEGAIRAAIQTPADTFEMDQFLSELSRESPG